MIIFDDLYKKHEEMIARLHKEGNKLFSNFYFHDVTQNFDSSLKQRLSSSHEIKSICNDYNVVASISQNTFVTKQDTSNTAFIKLKSTFNTAKVSISFYLEANPHDIKKNLLKFSSFSMKNQQLSVDVDDREVTIHLNEAGHHYFIICKDPYQNNELAFGLRGYELKDYKKAVNRYNKDYKESYPEKADFYLTFDFLNKLYESNIFESNPDLVGTILMNAFNGVKGDKELVEILELTHDVKLKFLTNPCPLLQMYDNKNTSNKIKNSI